MSRRPAPVAGHDRDERVAEHVRACPGDLDAGCPGEVAQAAGGRVPARPGAACVQQDRPAVPEAGRLAGGSGTRTTLVPLPQTPKDPVAVLLAQAGSVRADGPGDPQAGQAGHGHQREAARVTRLPGRGEQGPGLQVREPQRG